MKTRLLFVPLCIAFVAALAACGGGSQSVPANSVAVVGGTPITLIEFNTLVAQATKQATAGGGPAPKPGTPQYTAMKNQIIAYLVQVTELEQQAQKEGITVTDADVTKYIENLAKTRYNGSMSKLTDALKAQGLTMDAARKQVRVNLIAQKIHDKVTKSAKVTDAEVQQYYDQNKATSYSVPASTTRSVEHILVKEKSLADKIEKELKHGASFAKLAKKYSKDPGSAAQGGKYTATKGREVKAYDDVAFSIKTGQLSAPVDSTATANGGYGWFIIKALGDVKSTPAHTTPLSQVKDQIKQTLLQQAQDKLWQQWLSDLTKQYEGKVTYQSGYAPPSTTLPPTTT